MATKRKAERPEIVVEGGEEGERRAEEAEGENPQREAGGIGYQMVRHQLEDLPGHQ